MRYQIYIILCLRNISVILFENTQIHNRSILFLYRFYHCLQYALEKETVSTTSHPKEKVNTSYIRKKKRNPAKARGKRVTEGNEKELESNDHDDPGISVTIFPEDC